MGARSLNLSIPDFADAELASRLGSAVASLIGTLSNTIDLERLDGVTIAADYPRALASVDRGCSDLKPVEASTEHATGMAMNVHVWREGKVMSHIVYDGSLMRHLLNPEHADHGPARYILAHELMHVQDLKIKDQAFPGFYLQHKYPNRYELILNETAMGCMDEYVACIHSAAVNPPQAALFEEIVVSSLGTAKKEIRQAIAALTASGQAAIEQIPIIERWTTHLMKSTSYLVGHLDGLGEDLAHGAPHAAAVLKGSWFEPVYGELSKELRDLFKSYGAWPSLQVFGPLKGVYRRCLYEAGLSIEEPIAGDDGYRVRLSPKSVAWQ